MFLISITKFFIVSTIPRKALESLWLKSQNASFEFYLTSFENSPCLYTKKQDFSINLPIFRSVLKALSQISLLIFALLFCNAQPNYGQQKQYNFRHFTPNEGLSNENVNDIIKDKAGFIWLATSLGLNRFDGKNLVQYFHDKKDSSSLASDLVFAIYEDQQSNIWAGGSGGLSCLNQTTQKFTRYLAKCTILKIKANNNGQVFLGTNKGLKIVNQKTRQIADIHVVDPVLDSLLQFRINDFFITKNGQFYLAGNYGILVINWATKQYKLINDGPKTGRLIENNSVQAIVLDHDNRLWAATGEEGSMVYQFSPDLKTTTPFFYFLKKQNKFVPNRIQALRCDERNNIWLNTTDFGLSVIEAKSRSIYSYLNNPLKPNSISSNFCTSGLLIDNEGIIWVGVLGGFDYFNPNKILFSAIEVEPFVEKTLLHNWGRAVAEDNQSNLWLATGRGVSLFNKQKGIVKNFDGRYFQSNSIRSLLNENNQFIWIGTASGLSKYHLKTGFIQKYFIDDSIPDPFVHCIYKTKTGQLYAGCNTGLYEYLPEKDKFLNLKKVPEFKEIANNVITNIQEDQSDNIWFGSLKGVYLFSPKTGKVLKQFTETSKPALTYNSIRAIYLDKKGNMWVGTYNGLNCISADYSQNTQYTTSQGLSNNTICGLETDAKNRLWVGTARGLCVVENGKVIYQFGLEDGLTTTQFNDQKAYKINDGNLVFPSQKGFVVFDPNAFNWSLENPTIHISKLNILSENQHNILDIQHQKSLNLKHNENFFDIEMIALNYLNPRQSWYSYQLEGFDKDWIYTQNPIAQYTNVPGGQYTFKYRTSNNRLDWQVAEKQLFIEIETVFYKSWWFLTFMVLALLSSLYLYLKWSLENTKKMSELTSKTQLLEKEKALVMYENLKQHLNPHFLFNSLTSLSSLIRFDQVQASDFLDKMSKVYRYILKNRDNETVPLGEEIKFVGLYNQLQKTRFESGLEINIDIKEEHFYRKIAPVTLQNLVENAIKHNIASAEMPLKIDLYLERNYLIVENNLQKKCFVETSNKQGLVNMKSLYKYLSNEPMIIEETEKTFTVKIPLV